MTDTNTKKPRVTEVVQAEAFRAGDAHPTTARPRQYLARTEYGECDTRTTREYTVTAGSISEAHTVAKQALVDGEILINVQPVPEETA